MTKIPKAVPALPLVVLASVLTVPGVAQAMDSDGHSVAGGLSVYLGVLPAAIVRGHPAFHTESAMHGGAARGRYNQHVTVAVFDSETGDRIEDAVVEARVSSVGLAGQRRRLEPMEIAGTVTYGNYFTMRVGDIYRIAVSINWAGETEPTVLQFTHDLRRR